ncbi:MAG TPA: hypothetical protein VFO36_12380 [Nitrospiraceae bacterium]|jgi:hypothetical protein|nr:hypothetical protein [Nitrospiraceae bacterium]
MLGQFHRGELPELSSSRGTAAAPDAEAIVKRPPTEFERVIARRRAEGLTLQSIGTEFGITADHVRIICRRVEDYDRGTALLRDDPASIEALALLGQVKPLVREMLRYRGIRQLTDLEGVTMEEMLSWPNVGRQSATILLNALANLKKSE